MDGGSTDGTVEILREYGDRVLYVSRPDGGQSDAVNRGFQTAKGEIVGWLNSDDRYCPDAISKSVSALVANPAASMVYGEADLIGEDGTVLERFPSTQAFDLWKLVNVSDFIMQPTVFMRAAAVRENRWTGRVAPFWNGLGPLDPAGVPGRGGRPRRGDCADP